MQKNLGGMLKGINELQKRMDTVQKEIAEQVFEGNSAQGMVKVKMTGKGEIKSVAIDPSLMTEDSETLGDLVTVAAKNAYDAKEAVAKEKLSGIAKGLLPMGLKLPGLG